MTALKNSLILAVLSSLIATVIGTFAALGLHHMKSRALKGTVTSITNIPMMNPDIVTGVSMMLLFVAVAGIIKANNFMGFGTMLVAHTTFNLPYVLLSVTPRFAQLDKSLSEAAQDLGCTPAKAFFSVELPEIIPGIVSGLMLAFTMSLDDFAVTFFTRGTIGLDTLSTYIYTDARKGGLTPELRPMITILFVGILALLIIINLRKARAAEKANAK
jgi:spermidine/putrescine transport system permease protein